MRVSEFGNKSFAALMCVYVNVREAHKSSDDPRPQLSAKNGYNLAALQEEGGVFNIVWRRWSLAVIAATRVDVDIEQSLGGGGGLWPTAVL